MKIFIALTVFLMSATACFSQTFFAIRKIAFPNGNVYSARGSDLTVFSRKLIISAGINAVNDSGFDVENRNKNLRNFLDAKSWDLSVPSLQVDYGFSRSFYLSGMISINSNGGSGIKMSAADINLKYTFTRFMPDDYWLEPYLLIGGGFTWREAARKDNFNLDFGLGSLFWLDSHWGGKCSGHG